MSFLIVGLANFLGVHSLRIFASDWRDAQFARLGENTWKGLYSLASALGLGLIIWGYGMARVDPVILWPTPAWTKHAAALLTLPAFILIVAAYIPGNRIKAAVGHPMVAGAKLWALAHLVANGNLADVVLFGSFLIWAAASFSTSRRHDRIAGKKYPALGWSRDAAVLGVGTVVWASFAMFAHTWMIGVRPY